MIKTSAILALLLATTACTREAGQPLSGTIFGNSTTNNAAVMSGERDFAIQLAGRFAEEVPTTINFDFDSARLDSAARATLDLQAHWIKQFPEVRFRVYGHTDAVGSSTYNNRLGKRRAQAAVNYLVSKGISRSRLEAMVSYGETQPLIVTQQRERRNRRTVTEVSGFLKRHPTVLDGKYAQIIYREYVASAVPATTLTAEQTLQSTLD
ncbi:OmpA family protein [Phaeobacter sp. QD34_3]|uniref:OmpA family protein n=1 Tax=unclassified Phaeobacter TaxID=2621772 RepID=UPI00237F2D2B|nr:MULTISPECIES: OmpA family protein [unclassified Phaeobacter]MDE4132685.1 OmpA family protein [Phaeobacter sp. QD34_3]MDE4136522.1 OmpA family protein [Phaeobacter sp. QD34_24]MDE4173289.1 OmpA family protein [Phaeobacter sp. PT47_59]